MSSEIKADKWSPATGTSATLGDSGDTFTIPTGAGLTVTDEVKTNKISPASGTAFTLGDSGDTFTIPSGATITNSGTATGFGGGSTGLITSGSWATDSDNIDIASCFSNSDGYDAYKLILNGLSVTSDTQLWLRFKSAS